MSTTRTPSSLRMEELLASSAMVVLAAVVGVWTDAGGLGGAAGVKGSWFCAQARNGCRS
ncbi:MAG: hypothetical protein L0Y58_22170 [Verrucomicrobia subdivision 3 bacterium]|nr:hypothetical protein [Limisphaerales bacterium]